MQKANQTPKSQGCSSQSTPDFYCLKSMLRKLFLQHLLHQQHSDLQSLQESNSTIFQRQTRYCIENLIIFPHWQFDLFSQNGIILTGFIIINPVVLHKCPIKLIYNGLRISTDRRILFNIAFQSIPSRSSSYSSFFFQNKNRFTAKSAPWQNSRINTSTVIIFLLLCTERPYP